MKNIILITLGLTALFSCNQPTNSDATDAADKLETKVLEKNIVEVAQESADQTNPGWVVNQIFEAAKTNNYESLLKLCDPEGEGDGDTRQICSIYSAPKESKAEFKNYFKFGQIIGKPVIFENQAKVQIKFGPNGDKDETMNLINRNGKWYLSSF